MDHGASLRRHLRQTFKAGQIHSDPLWDVVQTATRIDQNSAGSGHRETGTFLHQRYFAVRDVTNHLHATYLMLTHVNTADIETRALLALSFFFLLLMGWLMCIFIPSYQLTKRIRCHLFFSGETSSSTASSR